MTNEPERDKKLHKALRKVLKDTLRVDPATVWESRNHSGTTCPDSGHDASPKKTA